MEINESILSCEHFFVSTKSSSSISGNFKATLNSQKSKLFRLIRKKRKHPSDPKFKHGRWTEKEHQCFLKGVIKLGKNNWKKVNKNSEKNN